MQLDITDDGFLSLMTDGGDTKDDVKVPDGEVGDKINKLFKEDEKDTSKRHSAKCYFAVESHADCSPRRHHPCFHGRGVLH